MAHGVDPDQIWSGSTLFAQDLFVRILKIIMIDIAICFVMT